MKGRTSQALLERLITGGRCEVEGCYEMAVWLVSFNEEAAHWCPKHTRINMRDVGQWGDLIRSDLA